MEVLLSAGGSSESFHTVSRLVSARYRPFSSLSLDASKARAKRLNSRRAQQQVALRKLITMFEEEHAASGLKKRPSNVAGKSFEIIWTPGVVQSPRVCC